MRHLRTLFSLLTMLTISSCAQKEEADEPDYENIVMADEEEGSISDEERDRKMIAGDLPDPQEQLIVEPPDSLN